MGLNTVKEKCNICSRPADKPYRHYDSQYKLTEGCIDGFHNNAILDPVSQQWHNRKEARKFRKTQKRII